jgi:hypothetical protein
MICAVCRVAWRGRFRAGGFLQSLSFLYSRYVHQGPAVETLARFPETLGNCQPCNQMTELSVSLASCMFGLVYESVTKFCVVELGVQAEAQSLTLLRLQPMTFQRLPRLCATKNRPIPFPQCLQRDRFRRNPV